MSRAASTVKEALDAIAAPDVVTRILQRALHLAQESEIPLGGSRLQRFVERHLFPATNFVLGADAAGALLAQLAPLLTRIPSLLPHEPTAAALQVLRGLQADPLEGAPLEGAPLEIALEVAVPVAGPVGIVPVVTVRAPIHVLFATLDPFRSKALQHELRGEASVEVIEDVVALLDAIMDADDDLTILVDCLDPSVQPTTLATVAAELPASAVVILWGAAGIQEQEAKLLVDDASNWLTCTMDASARDVATLLRSLL